MSGTWMLRSGALIGLLCASWSPCQAAPPWAALASVKPVDADPAQTYPVTEENGPWLVMACSFSGDGAEKQAKDLVHELRRSYRLPAYTYKGHFDLGEPAGRGHVDKYGNPRKWKYLKQDKSHVELDEVAVLVGDYPSADDPELQKVLKKIKYAEPKCLEIKEGKATHQTLTGWRMIEKQLYETMVGEKKTEGPMGHAFVTRNPILPLEYFVSTNSVDDEVLSLNRGVPYSLLECQGKYTVRVATFKGRVIISQNEIKEIEDGTREMKSELAKAAEKADRLTKALREKGYQAYQFHDRNSSIVTVGSFNSVGMPRTDGRIEIDPAIHKIMQLFAAKTATLPNQATPVSQPQMLVGIPFDIQPIPVEVPKRSISVAMRKNTAD